MKVLCVDRLVGTDREVKCPRGGFTSLRILLEKDKMGFTLTRTSIPKGAPQHWHYRRHLEACYCISGTGILTDRKTGVKRGILPGTVYILDKNDDHDFEAISDVVLLCVF